ncbi:MAG TPA: methyltransferase domain-containing protein [Dehalococcoidia bacterium]
MSGVPSTVDFDGLAPSYDGARRANPELVALLRRHLPLRPGSLVLDLGCGTGNYTVPAAEAGARVVGADLSRGMLARAAGKSRLPAWVQADGHRLPFPDATFDAALAVLVLHHIPDWERVVAEVRRVLRRGRFAVLLATAEQIRAFWLFHYFPEGLEIFLRHRPTLPEVRQRFREAGFAGLAALPFQYRRFEDGALMVGKRNPALYLDPAVQGGISLFRRIPPERVAEGLARLRRDVESGRIRDVLRRYPTGPDDPGDAYLFLADTHDPVPEATA